MRTLAIDIQNSSSSTSSVAEDHLNGNRVDYENMAPGEEVGGRRVFFGGEGGKCDNNGGRLNLIQKRTNLSVLLTVWRSRGRKKGWGRGRRAGLTTTGGFKFNLEKD